MDLGKVIELFESKHSADLADRHAQSIILLCEEMNNELARSGFYFREMDQITRVLQLIHQGLSKGKVSIPLIFKYAKVVTDPAFELI